MFPRGLPAWRSYETLMALLRYMYADTVTVDGDAALDVFIAADRYGITRLRNECARRLQASLDPQTVAHVLTAADAHGCDSLKEVRGRG